MSTRTGIVWSLRPSSEVKLSESIVSGARVEQVERGSSKYSSRSNRSQVMLMSLSSQALQPRARNLWRTTAFKSFGADSQV